MPVSAGTQSLRAYLEYWIMVCRTRLRPITLVTYARDVRRLTAVLGDVPLRNLTPGLVQSAYAALLDQAFSKRTVEKPTGRCTRRWLLSGSIFWRCRRQSRPANAVYTFTSLGVTSTAVHIEWTVAGALIDDPRLVNHGTQTETQLTSDYFLPRLFDSAGHETQNSVSGITFSRPVKVKFMASASGQTRRQRNL